jgi:hypothetical protein
MFGRTVRPESPRGRGIRGHGAHNVGGPGVVTRASVDRDWIDGPEEREAMIVLGIILLILGLVLNAGILWTIGIILIIGGIILNLLGMMDRAIGPRRYYY